MSRDGNGSDLNGFWGKFPASVLDVLPDLTCSELRVYVAIAGHARRAGFSATVGMKDLVDDTGLNERTIQRAVKSLEKRGGVLRRTINRGRHNTNVYDLLENSQGGGGRKPDTQDAGISSVENPSPKVSGYKPENPSPGDQKPDTQSVAPLKKISSEKKKRAADAASAAVTHSVNCEDQKLAALTDAGLQANDRTRTLSENPLLTVETIREHARSGLRNGILVNRLEAAATEAAELDQIRQRDTAARERRDRERAAAERERLDLERSRAAARDVIGRHTDDEVDAAFQHHLLSIENEVARGRTALRNCTTYVAAILEAKATNLNRHAKRNGKSRSQLVGAGRMIRHLQEANA